MRYVAYIEPEKCKIFFEAADDRQAQDQAMIAFARAILVDALEVVKVEPDETFACKDCGKRLYRSKLLELDGDLYCFDCGIENHDLF